MTRKPLLWLVPLLGAAALLAFLLRTADTPPASGVVAVAAAPEPVPTASPPPMALAPPELTRVMLDGARSTGRFRLADGSERVIGPGALLQPGWTLAALDSGSARFDTPDGPRHVPLSAAPVVEARAPARTVLVPDAPAKTADGEAVTRCTDPEC
jgi:hypothetical protein